MTVKAKTVMRGRGQRAAFTIQIVTPVANALHAFRKGQITTPEKLLCWQQQFNNSTKKTTLRVDCECTLQ